MIKSQIGNNAGRIWRLIDELNGEVSYDELKEISCLCEIDILLAIGWLSRENKVYLFNIEGDDWMIQLIY